MVAGDMTQNAESIQTRTAEIKFRISIAKIIKNLVLVECTDIYIDNLHLT
jgi:hypothetical protein